MLDMVSRFEGRAYNITIKKMKIIHGDCIEELKKLEENSVDAIVTDPPYGLSFMGKKWDYDVPSVEVWKECLRVMKPGAFLLSFAGTRTYHRMAVNIKDAGFEIRDMISWLYGSGFPKSLNIGKQIDKIEGNERKFVCKNPANRPYNLTKGETSTGWKSPPRPDKDKGTSEWEGWGTALKPACEPIVVARKPLSEKNVASNVLKWGTGGINIDACRIGSNGGTCRGEQGERMKDVKQGFRANSIINNINQGRFPANIILDEEAGKILDEQSGISKSQGHFPKDNTNGTSIFNTQNLKQEEKWLDKGGASRFFYCAKASKSERNNFGEVLFELKKDTPKEIKVEIEKYLNTD